ncbi:MAG: heat-inducible transcription repressor HrcA [Thermomicrobiales bacterium]|nr:heat-inducible transcription repressor HrcA [Thermomicrobiales bacterium]
MDTRTQHNPEDMTARRQQLLQLLVREYVDSGKPVGSATLAARFGAPISSATIRNEMVALEHMGYVAQPHTSGGRVPTDLGYRYYVHNLMPNHALAQSEQVMIRHQFRQVEAQLDSMVEFAASVLSSTSGMASIVTAPRTHIPRLRHFELVSLQPRLALMILVTQESAVRQMMLHLPEEAEQPLLSSIADQQVGMLRGLTSAEIVPFAQASSGLIGFVLEQIASGLRTMDSLQDTPVRHSGIDKILMQPEFSGTEGQLVVELMHGSGLLGQLLPQLTPGEDVQVFIGEENPAQALRNFGIVIATYGIDGEVTGILGVLGPTRMRYWHSIPSVRYMARLMSDLMSDLYSA